ncbi:hypothetical protein HY251_21695 [bacterium]|nr:hypothetical protein [bacterium]
MNRIALATVAALCAVATAEAGSPAVVHIQTDKPIYRLGDTVWYRVHVSPAGQDVTVSLKREGSVLATKNGPAKADQPIDGSFLIPEDWPGGDYNLVAESGGRVQHEVRFQVYDVAARAFDLALAVVGDTHEPGEQVAAAVSAPGRIGRPIEGARVRYRATFGAVETDGWAGPTDNEGQAVIRFSIPKGAQTSGFLSAGIEWEKKVGAVAQPVLVSASVARVDAFPEGGTIVAGGAHRLGLLVRDLNGDPVIAEGRVVDDKGACVGAWKTDHRGLSLVDVVYEKGRSYEARIDRPAGVETRFPLPGPSGHAHAIRILNREKQLAVELRGAKTQERAEILLVSGEKIIARKPIGISRDGEAVSVFFPEPAAFTAAHVIVMIGDRATLKCPVILGTTWPLAVQIVPRDGGREFPGETVTFDVQTTIAGKPVSTDLALSVFNTGLLENGRWAVPDLGARALLRSCVEGTISDAADLFDASEGALERRTAYLLVHGSFVFPKEGVRVDDAGENGLPGDEVGRVVAPPVPPRAPVQEEKAREGETVARAAARTLLDRAIQRAPFTRRDAPRVDPGEQKFAHASEDEQREQPGHGKLATLPPQDVQLPASRLDCRDTLYWKSRITTDRTGHAVLKFKVGSEVSPYSIVCQGWVEGQPVSHVAALRPKPNFATKFAFPSHVTVGDRFEVLVETEILDGAKDPLDISVDCPPCLKPLERTVVQHDPWVSNRVTRFLFLVVGTAEKARFQVVIQRIGLWSSDACREVTTRTFSAGYPELELTFGKTGFQSGSQAMQIKIPENAVSGSVCARSRVVPPSPTAEAEESLESLLHEPHGCFEQTTATNYPNLVILERLVNEGSDGATLARASAFAQNGFDLMVSFQVPSGGFRLWADRGDAETRYTAMAIMQIGAFAKLFKGKGSFEVAKALRWLERHEKSESLANLYAAFAVNDAGLPWEGRARALHVKPKTSYERALLASLIASWKGEWPEKKPREKVLTEILLELEKAAEPSGRIPSEGAGIMGSMGDTLAIETTALAALAFREGGMIARADRCLAALSALKHGGHWWGTQAAALSIRAFAGAVKAGGNPLPEPVVVTFTAGGQAPVTASVGGERQRPLVLSRPLSAAPGSTVSLALDMKTQTPVEYGLSCTYRVASPESARHAPYKISTSMGNGTATLGQTENLTVTIDSIAPGASGQVCAVIGIPAGCTFDADACCHLAGASHVEKREGALVLYWEMAPASTKIQVPLTPTNAGTFHAPPSVIYPYYECGKEAFASGFELEVRHPGAPDRPKGMTVPLRPR